MSNKSVIYLSNSSCIVLVPGTHQSGDRTGHAAVKIKKKHRLPFSHGRATFNNKEIKKLKIKKKGEKKEFLVVIMIVVCVRALSISRGRPFCFNIEKRGTYVEMLFQLRCCC